MDTSIADPAREPWNKGKLVGQKTPFKLKEIWAIRIRLQIAIGAEISQSSIWLSIANFEPATLCNCVYATSAMVRSWRPEPSSCSKKPADLYSLRSLNRRARRYQLGLPVQN